MIQMALFLVFVLLVAFGFSWLSDQPGSILINFAGYERLFSPVEFILALIVLFSALFAIWILMQRIVSVPDVISRFFKRRREKRGLEALSAGLIAVGIGDRNGANRFSSQVKRSLPNEPLTALLRAQSAQLTGDRATARRIYEAMLETPDTELLGLRGLFLEAQHENEDEAAFQFVKQAVTLNPRLQWSVVELFQYQCKKGDWGGALKTLDIAKQYKHVERTIANRRRAVLLTAQAVDMEDDDIDKALVLALEAHNLASNLIPAAELAGRILASKGNTGKAAKVISRTWKQSPHPDLALMYAFVRPGDSPKDRLQRMQTLAAMVPDSMEGPVAVAIASIDAKEWDMARDALKELVEHEPTARVCTLMARIEGEQGDQGRMREWLARAVRAPRDPVWSADGYVSAKWLPVSPETGLLDSFDWKVPVETVGGVVQDSESLLPLEVISGVHDGTANTGAKGEFGPGIENETRRWQEDEMQEVEVTAVREASKIQEQMSEHEAEVSETQSMPPVVSKETSIVSADKEQDTGTELIAKPEDKLQRKEAIAKKESDLGEDQNATTLKPKYAQRPVSQPHIFVAPHAPDDPGVAPEEEEDSSGAEYVVKSD